MYVCVYVYMYICMYIIDRDRTALFCLPRIKCWVSGCRSISVIKVKAFFITASGALICVHHCRISVSAIRIRLSWVVDEPALARFRFCARVLRPLPPTRKVPRPPSDRVKFSLLPTRFGSLACSLSLALRKREEESRGREGRWRSRWWEGGGRDLERGVEAPLP